MSDRQMNEAHEKLKASNARWVRCNTRQFHAELTVLATGRGGNPWFPDNTTSDVSYWCFYLYADVVAAGVNPGPFTAGEPFVWWSPALPLVGATVCAVANAAWPRGMTHDEAIDACRRAEIHTAMLAAAVSAQRLEP